MFSHTKTPTQQSFQIRCFTNKINKLSTFFAEKVLKQREGFPEEEKKLVIRKLNGTIFSYCINFDPINIKYCSILQSNAH